MHAFGPLGTTALTPRADTIGVNDYRIPSGPILIGACDYPEQVIEKLKEKADTTVIQAGKIAKQIGNPRTMNLVLFGALVKGMNLTDIDFESEIAANVKPETLKLNLEAFRAGIAALEK